MDTKSRSIKFAIEMLFFHNNFDSPSNYTVTHLFLSEFSF